MKERLFCQSCGMPLDRAEDMGTEAGGAKTSTYVKYSGDFTAPEATLEDMIALNLKFNEENGRPMGTRAEAEQMMRSWYPTLKRWRQG